MSRMTMLFVFALALCVTSVSEAQLFRRFTRPAPAMNNQMMQPVQLYRAQPAMNYGQQPYVQQQYNRQGYVQQQYYYVPSTQYRQQVRYQGAPNCGCNSNVAGMQQYQQQGMYGQRYVNPYANTNYGVQPAQVQQPTQIPGAQPTIASDVSVDPGVVPASATEPTYAQPENILDGSATPENVVQGTIEQSTNTVDTFPPVNTGVAPAIEPPASGDVFLNEGAPEIQVPGGEIPEAVPGSIPGSILDTGSGG